MENGFGLVVGMMGDDDTEELVLVNDLLEKCQP